MMISNKEIENIDIKNVVILDTDKSGDIYMENLFPLWTNVIVVTLEGKYPKNDHLKKIVFDRIENDPSINCIQFGSNSEKYPVKSEKRLRMSHFLLKDLTYLSYQKPEFNFDHGMIISLMMSFTGDSISRLSKERLQTYDSIINRADSTSIKWFHDLLKSK